MSMKGPIANLEETISRLRAELYAALPLLSALFIEHGDPRKWTEDGVQPIAWNSGINLGQTAVAYDEWLSGAWNDVEGVIPPPTDPD